MNARHLLRDVLAAFVVGALVGWMLTESATPCTDGQLCMALLGTAGPDRNWLHRLVIAIRVRLLRWRIASASNDLLMLEAQAMWLPDQIALHQQCISTWREELADMVLPGAKP